MHLLTTVNNNIKEWRELLEVNLARPRLPLPYVFGGAFLKAGHDLSALDLTSLTDRYDISPFKELYHRQELEKALKNVDVATLWGSYALKAIFRQMITPGSKNNILYFTYVLSPENPTIKQSIYDLSLRMVVRAAKGLVLMTVEQTRKAEEMLHGITPVINMRCGIDTAFYREASVVADVPECERRHIDKLLADPYVIMPGDELRFNDDAIRFVEQTGIRLVRISQYGYKSGTEKLKRDVAERGLNDRLLIFENIEYSFLRFLLQHASAYAGFVDSSWQPAGWTVACEALASGLPMVIYDGLTSRELGEAGVLERLVQDVAMGDIVTFTDKLVALVESNTLEKCSELATSFAEQNLDFSITAPKFVSEIEKMVFTE